MVGGQRIRKDTKTHQDRYLAIDPVTCSMISEHLHTVRAELAAVGLELPDDAYMFSNDPMGARPWNPDWATHKASDLAAAAGVKLNIKGLRPYTASQLLAARFDLRNTAARLGHGSVGATTLRRAIAPETLAALGLSGDPVHARRPYGPVILLLCVTSLRTTCPAGGRGRHGGDCLQTSGTRIPHRKLPDGAPSSPWLGACAGSVSADSTQPMGLTSYSCRAP